MTSKRYRHLAADKSHHSTIAALASTVSRRFRRGGIRRALVTVCGPPLRRPVATQASCRARGRWLRCSAASTQAFCNWKSKFNSA